MRVEVLVPQIGEAVAELILVAWHKQVGDTVVKGDLLFEIDSDKAIVEVDAFVGGTLTKILQPGESAVMPKQVVAIIETADEVPSVDGNGGAASQTASMQKSDEGDKSVAAEKGPPTEQQDAPPDDAPRERARPNISPKARRLAKDAGIDWMRIAGSGADGMILVSDVQRAVAAKGAGNS